MVVSYSISTSNHNLPLAQTRMCLVVSYSISTSNHNHFGESIGFISLYLIPFLHQTTTIEVFLLLTLGCILFHFYIKPQHYYDIQTFLKVVSYSISTSNHNFPICMDLNRVVVSYSISTSNHNLKDVQEVRRRVVSYSISTSNHNILRRNNVLKEVVSYSISTSNHNC